MSARTSSESADTALQDILDAYVEMNQEYVPPPWVRPLSTMNLMYANPTVAHLPFDLRYDWDKV